MMGAMRTARPSRPRRLQLAAAALGRADLAIVAFALIGLGSVRSRSIYDNTGRFDLATFALSLSTVLLAMAVALAALRRPAKPPTPLVCSLAIASQLLVVQAFPHLRLVVATILCLAAVPLLPRSWMRRMGLGLGTGMLLAWITLMLPINPHIDVFEMVKGSTAALLHGQNPYAPVYQVYLDSDKLHPIFGTGAFGYGPMVILLSLPAALLGDVRLTQVALLAMLGAAIAVWTRRALGERQATSIVAVFVASPFLPFMVLMEWTDTFSIVGTAWWLLLRDRHRVWATVALTAAMASKPTMLPLILPLLVWERTAWRELLVSMVATIAIAAPFAIATGVAQFVYDTVGIYVDLPIRHDGLTLDGLAASLGMPYPPAALLLAASVVAVVLVVRRRPRDLGDALGGGALLLVVLCLLAKQAFLNYYFNSAVALLLVAGAGAAGQGMGAEVAAAGGRLWGRLRRIGIRRSWVPGRAATH